MYCDTKKLVIFVLILVFVGSLSVTSVQPINATGEAWSEKASMQVARGHVGVATANEKVYVIGGDYVNLCGNCITAGFGKVYNTTEEYNPATDTWVFKAAMPTPRANFGVAVYQNKIYCFGGYIGNGKCTNITEVYDPATDTWEMKSPMPTARLDLQAHTVNGKIYLIGGRTGSASPYLEVNEVYDPTTDTWTTQISVPYRITTGASAVANNKIYFLGTESKLDSGPFTQIYDTQQDSWSKGATAPTYGSWSTTAVTVSIEGHQQIVFFRESSTYVYYPTNDTWMIGTTIPSSRGFIGATVVNETVYVIGGIPAPFTGYIVITSSTGKNECYKLSNEPELVPVTNIDPKIYIRADGTIEPSTANITTTDKVVYTFTGNNYERMIIERDNIIIDGNGYMLQGTGSYGISLFQRHNITITNLTVRDFSTAEIGLDNSNNIIITQTTLIAGMNDGIRANNSSNNMITYNDITGGCGSAVQFTSNSNNNWFSDNMVTEGWISISSSSNNTITRNQVTDVICISVYGATNNHIFHNSFTPDSFLDLARANNAPNNNWNSSYFVGGNYWIDYNGTDNNQDGIGDTPYVIDENNIDYYPLMSPINSFDVGIWNWTAYRIKVISNLIASKVSFNPENKAITINTVTRTNEQSEPFRVIVPKDLLSTKDQWMVLVNDNLVTPVTKEDSNNSYIYFNCTTKTRTITITGTTAIPEFSTLTPITLICSGCIAVLVIHKRKLSVTHQ